MFERAWVSFQVDRLTLLPAIQTMPVRVGLTQTVGAAVPCDAFLRGGASQRLPLVRSRPHSQLDHAGKVLTALPDES